MVVVEEPPTPSMSDDAMVPASTAAVAPEVFTLAAAFLLDLAELGSAFLFPSAFALAFVLGLAGAAGLAKQACCERLPAL